MLAMCFSILQHCCAQSLPSGFHFQPESTRKIRARPHGKSAATCTKFTSASAEDPRHPCRRIASFHTTIHGCLRGTTMEFLGKFKFSVSCSVRGYIHVVAVKMPSTVEVCAEWRTCAEVLHSIKKEVKQANGCVRQSLTSEHRLAWSSVWFTVLTVTIPLKTVLLQLL